MDSKRSRNDFDGQWKLPLIPDYLKRWATLTPGNEAIVFADNGAVLNFAAFEEASDLYAMRLKKMGLGKGDIVVTQYLAAPEFFILLYGCLKIGAVLSPIDVRLQDHEVVRDMDKVRAAAFFCLGKTPIRDFTVVAETVRDACPYVKHLVQWSPVANPGEIVDGAANFEDLFSPAALEDLASDETLKRELADGYDEIDAKDPALIIYTTGTTGDPKPAMMSHANIITNNCVLSRGVGLFGTDFRFINMMPTSHVAGTAQGPMTTWFVGGAIVTMSVFHPAKALEAIQQYKATFIGGVPTQFRMMWALPNYHDFDLSSLRYSIYGGSAVDTPFLEELAKMSPTFGTALGMTESAGYFTCTPKGISVAEMAGQVGQYFPDLAVVTIRKPMNENRTAGEELPKGEAGEICVAGGVVFLGYYNNPEATDQCITKEGILYTGDMGRLKDMGTYEALVFAGRRKFVIKPKGYLVFPDEVTDFISQHPAVNQAHVVGVPHKLFTDGVFAFVQPAEESGVDPKEILEYCKGIASYKRPLHVEMWPTGEQFPLNRVNKVDSLKMIEKATALVEGLRAEGKWDAG